MPAAKRCFFAPMMTSHSMIATSAIGDEYKAWAQWLFDRVRETLAEK